MAAPIRIATVNVQGIKNASKDKVMKICELAKQYDIIVLTETHVKNPAELSVFERVSISNFKAIISYATEEAPKAGLIILFNHKYMFGNFRKIFQINGRAIAVSFQVLSKVFFLVGLYAPGHRDLRQGFYSGLRHKIEENSEICADFVFCLGDFNFVENQNLDRSENTQDRVPPGLNEFNGLKDLYSLKDVYRFLKPTGKLYTFFSKIHKTQARLDRIYGNCEVYENSKNCAVKACAFSDHSIFSMVFDYPFGCMERGSSYWKLNFLLLEESCAKFRIEQNLLDIELDFSIEKWEVFKNEISRYFKWLGKIIAFERKSKEKSLERSIIEIRKEAAEQPQNIDIKMKHQKLLLEKQTIETRKAKQIIFSTHYKDLIEDRVSVTRAKTLKKMSANTRIFLELKKQDGTIVKTNTEILYEVTTYFEKLFLQGLNYPDAQNRIINSIDKKLDEFENLQLKGPITADEVKSAISSFKNNKCPGLDGLPIEFYKSHSRFIPCLVLLYNKIFENESVPGKFLQGVISLLYKEKGEKNELKNWRPLTMLNADYKILAKVLTNRLKTVMKRLVSVDQSCAVQGRDIRDNIFTVFNLVNFVNENNKEGFLLSLDHKNAFDLLEWDFMFQALEKFNICSDFIKWVKILYHIGAVKSSVQVNGFLGKIFDIRRGIRQGCPLSPLLYVLVTEAVSYHIKSCKAVQGIKVLDDTYKITKYADDTVLFLRDINSIDRVFEVFEVFRLASGSEINKSKTQLLPIGSSRNCIYPAEYEEYRTNSLKIYGFSIENGNFQSSTNLAKPMEDIENLASKMPYLEVSLYGKIVYINTYFLASLTYMLNIFSLTIEQILKVERAIDHHLWYPSKRNAISRAKLKLPKNKGGINYPCLLTKIHIFRLMTLINRWRDREAKRWHKTFDHFYDKVKNRKLLKRVQVPEWYKDLRRAQLASNFLKIDDENFSVFGTIFNMRNVKSQDLYKVIITNKNKNTMNQVIQYWDQVFQISSERFEQSFLLCKIPFVDGYTRTIHFKILHKALYTKIWEARDRRNVSVFCKKCPFILETVEHVIVYCAPAQILWGFLKELIFAIIGRQTLQEHEKIIGCFLTGNRESQNKINFVIQIAQRVLWQTRCQEIPRFTVQEFFKHRIKTVLLRCRQNISKEHFDDFFQDIYRFTQP